MELFVEAYQVAVDLAAALECPIIPFQATGYVLQQAKKEFEMYYEIRWYEFSAMKPAEVTNEYFVETCSSIIQRARAERIHHR